MISNQILQSTLDGLKKITRVDMCVVDTEGVMLASTFGEEVDFRDVVVSFENSPAESQVISNYQFFKVLDEGHLEYVLIASGNSDDVYTTGKLTAFQLQCLLIAYKERFDKDNFIK
ncbi:MAG TPA: CdaR family transcriptional regulator, partial [Lachnospiraceae bacterium]|nr:CdaR family transcriptional regulator [Lachnospiraceae bacterium]